MKKAITIFFLTFSGYFNGYCQSKFIINFHSDSSQQKVTSFRLLRPASNQPGQAPSAFFVSEKDSISNGLTRCVYETVDTSVCLIADGFGHESFVIPNDEIDISFKRLPKSTQHYPYILSGKYMSPFFNQFTYIGKNSKIYSLFDSLAYHTGGLFSGGDIGFKEVNHDLKLFFDTVSRQYTQRLAYLSAYFIKYNIPKNIREMALLEIKADYVGNLLEPLQNTVKEFDYTDYPKGYMDTLSSINFDNSRYFFRTKVFNQKAFTYIQLYKGRASLTGKIDDDDALRRIQNVINDHFKSKEIRERLFANLLISYRKFSCASYDSVLNVFHEQFPESKYAKYVDSSYYDFRSKATTSLVEGLSTGLTDRNGTTVQVKSVLKSRPVLIDCWASWCVPCLQQFSFSSQLEKEYAGKIDFVYLSFDRDEHKWLIKSNSLALKNSFLVKGDFKSMFANHFDINTIPRYILISSKGEIVNPNAPRPSNKEALEKTLKMALLNEK